MHKTKIDWATMSWNPVTGCCHGCPYCYAKRTANRFNAGLKDNAPLAGGLHVLTEKIASTPYPYGFEPTLHHYRLNQPERQAEPQTVLVCSMADLFGKWVPTSWIVKVLDACQRAPQHRYLFLTKNPERYIELDKLAVLPRRDNFWYGTTVTSDGDPFFISGDHKTFYSIEPIMGWAFKSGLDGADWVIVGAETGNRADKVVPRREWVNQIAEVCAASETPVFYKSNLREYFPDLPDSEFPWEMR